MRIVELAKYKKPTSKEMQIGTSARTKFFSSRTPGQQVYSNNLDPDNRVEGYDFLIEIKDEIYHNVGINSLKNIAKSSKKGTARFLIHQKTNALHAADYSKHDHGDIAPRDHDWEKPVTNGYITHSRHPTTGEDQYHMAAYRQNEKTQNFDRDDDHPVIKKMAEHGIKKGMLATRFAQVRPIRDTDNPNHFEVREDMKTLRDIVPEAENTKDFHTSRFKKKRNERPLGSEAAVNEISRDRINAYRDANDRDTTNNGNNIDKANDRIATIPQGNLSSRMNAYQARSTAMRRQSRRDKGLAMADRKLDTDPKKTDYGINEISTGLLMNYINKSAKSTANKAYALGQDSMNPIKRGERLPTRPVKKRVAGIATAAGKLAQRDFTYSPNPEKDAGDHEFR